MRLNYLDSIGYCKALCQDTGTIVTGRLVYFGAGRYCLQQGVDLSLNGDTYTAFRTDNIQDDLGNTYYVYWDQIKSAYLYLPLTEVSPTEIQLDIGKTTVVGNVILDELSEEILYGKIN